MKAFAFTLNGQAVTNNLQVNLAEEYAVAELYGLYMTREKQRVTHLTQIDHLKPRCVSRENYKGIVADFSRATFSGKVYVHKDAYLSQATQVNKNLLLNTTARIDTNPQLEIYNDDVKCSHGATVGQLDEQALFYLRSRGISVLEAKNILINAFAQEILAKVTCNSVKNYLFGKLR